MAAIESLAVWGMAKPDGQTSAQYLRLNAAGYRRHRPSLGYTEADFEDQEPRQQGLAPWYSAQACQRANRPLATAS